MHYVFLGSATLVHGLDTWNGASNDDGIGNFRAGSPILDNVHGDFWQPPARDHEEKAVEVFVEAVAGDGYGQVENEPMPATGYGTSTQPCDDLPQSDDSSGCSTPTDDLQMQVGLLDMPCKQMRACIRSLAEIDENTSMIRCYRGNNWCYQGYFCRLSNSQILHFYLKSVEYTAIVCCL